MSNISKQAREMAKKNGLKPEINQAYIDNVGAKYATAEEVEEAYSGEFANNEEFARDMADQLGSVNDNVKWPYTCIDWELAGRKLMYDYFEMDGYYFRNL